MVESILSRIQPSDSREFSPLQSQVDDWVGGFAEHAADWRSLTAMVAGGMAFRLGRMGALSLGSGNILNALSIGVGLTSEVTTFEMANRSLAALSGQGPQNHNLWKWTGTGGIRQGLLSSLITFGTLKGAGQLAQGENLIVQHLLQDTGMVLGHQVAGAFDIMPHPTGSLAEQFLHAEATNLQLGAAMALGRGLSPFHAEMEMETPEVLSGGREKRAEIFPVLYPHEPLPAEGIGQVSMMSHMGPGGPGGGNGGKRSEGLFGDPPSTKDPLIGQTIDNRYKIEAIIGTGGMGTVYSSTRTVLGKKVAVKVLRSTLSQDPKNVQRFLGEAKAASSIGHRNIIEVFDLGQLPNGAPYFVMEHLEGIPLSKLLERGRSVPMTRLIPIVRQVAEGLSAAHQVKIVHRDLKPQNIFLVDRDAEKDLVKILDFGIAKMLNNVSSDLTLVGDVLGTPKYMSPEQAAGRPVDQRSDIYAFGLLLYKMASGRLPFEHKDAASLMMAHTSEPPTPLRELPSLPQEISPRFDAIVLKCLSKDPTERYQTMKEVIADLDKLHLEESETVLSLTKVRRPTPVETVLPTPTPRISQLPMLAEKRRPQKSRWPLYLGLTGLLGSAVAYVLFNEEKFKNLLSTTPPPSTPAPQPSPLSTSSSPPSPTSSPVPVTPSPQKSSAIPTITLVMPKVKVGVTVDPPDAHVFQGGKDLGSDPVTVEVVEGSVVDLEIRREGYKTKRIKVDGFQDKVPVRLEQDTNAAPRPKTPVPSTSHPKTQPPPSTEKPEFPKFE